MSTSETGNAINAANFEDLISFCTGYGAAYNPAKAGIKIPALNILLSSSRSSLSAVNNALPVYNNTVAAREIAFAPLNKLITRVTSAAAASGAPKSQLTPITTIARKLQGRRAETKTTPDNLPEAPADASNPSPAALPADKTISVSQQSYDSRIENLEKLNQQLAAITQYIPNEIELKVATLNTLLADLKAKNTAVISAVTPLSNARINRNKILYDPSIGLVATAADVKTYVKSLFGASSPQYKQISSIKFNKLRGV